MAPAARPGPPVARSHHNLRGVGRTPPPKAHRGSGGSASGGPATALFGGGGGGGGDTMTGGEPAVIEARVM